MANFGPQKSYFSDKPWRERPGASLPNNFSVTRPGRRISLNNTDLAHRVEAVINSALRSFGLQAAILHLPISLDWLDRKVLTACCKRPSIGKASLKAKFNLDSYRIAVTQAWSTPILREVLIFCALESGPRRPSA
jgi:hypothetical protein